MDMSVLFFSGLALVGGMVAVAGGRAISGRRFERQMRRFAFDDEDQLFGIRPIALRPDPDLCAPRAADARDETRRHIRPRSA
jgi:hypothetical protein